MCRYFTISMSMKSFKISAIIKIMASPSIYTNCCKKTDGHIFYLNC